MALFMETMNFKDMLEVMMTNMITIKGDKGDPGDPGVPGKAGRTPVKGKDYFTKTEVDGIVARAATRARPDVRQIIKEATPTPGKDFPML